MLRLALFIVFILMIVLSIRPYKASALSFEMTSTSKYSKEALHILESFAEKFQTDAYEYLTTKNSDGVYQRSVTASFKLETKKKKSIESLMNLNLSDLSFFEAKDQDRVKHHVWKSFYLMNIMTNDRDDCEKSSEFLRSMDFKVSVHNLNLQPDSDKRIFSYKANLSANCDGKILISKIDILRILDTPKLGKNNESF